MRSVLPGAGTSIPVVFPLTQMSGGLAIVSWLKERVTRTGLLALTRTSSEGRVE